MDEIAISKFKATCLAVLHEVQRTGKPVRVTKFGKPVAEVVPPTTPRRAKRVFGLMADRTAILGDIISPAVPAEQWEAIGGRKPRRKRVPVRGPKTEDRRLRTKD
jgi:prevent-host-death family protein